MKKLFSASFLAVLLFSFFVPAGTVFASHPCTGDPSQYLITDAGHGHPCIQTAGGGNVSADTRITTLSGLLTRLNGIFNLIIPFIIGLAFLVIVWGIFTYIMHGAEEEKRQQGRAFVLWGIVGLFFMLTIWGFVAILVNSFDLQTTVPQNSIPKVPTIQ